MLSILLRLLEKWSVIFFPFQTVSFALHSRRLEPSTVLTYEALREIAPLLTVLVYPALVCALPLLLHSFIPTFILTVLDLMLKKGASLPCLSGLAGRGVWFYYNPLFPYLRADCLQKPKAREELVCLTRRYREQDSTVSSEVGPRASYREKRRLI